MQSEVELDEAITALHVLAAHPQLYELTARLGTVTSMLSLLTHENTDIVLSVVALFHELADDEVRESEVICHAIVREHSSLSFASPSSNMFYRASLTPIAC